jgi:hypothetical protein
MSSRAVAPLSAATVAAAFRSPCKLHCLSPAASHYLRNQFPNPASVNGFAWSVTINVRSPTGLASITRCSSGRIGISSAIGLRRRFFCCVNRNLPECTCLSAEAHQCGTEAIRLTDGLYPNLVGIMGLRSHALRPLRKPCGISLLRFGSRWTDQNSTQAGNELAPPHSITSSARRWQKARK